MQRARRAVLAVLTAVAAAAAACGTDAGPAPEVVVARPLEDEVLDGLSEVARARRGSSDPTYLPSNRRMALTSGGRALVVFGSHADGIQLAWRDGLQGWRTATQGDIPDGELLDDTGTGDWPASIVVGASPGGEELAWVVWGRSGFGTSAPLAMRRLRDLDHPDGPTIEPIVQLNDLATARPDMVAVVGPDGTEVVVGWLQETSTGRRQLAVASLVDPTGEELALGPAEVLDDGTSILRAITLAAEGDDVAAVIRGPNGRVEVLRRDARGAWSNGVPGVHADPQAQPVAVMLEDGSVLVAVEVRTQTDAPEDPTTPESPVWSDTARDGVTSRIAVDRFPPGRGAAERMVVVDGYAQPTLATDGSRVWLVAIRETDGLVVSRSYRPGEGWATEDHVEIDEIGGGNHAWPNAMRHVDDRLRFVVEGPADAVGRSSILAYQREV